jgi:integrase
MIMRASMQSERNEPKKRRATGIDERHSRSCRSRAGSKCNCDPSYGAWVYDARSGQKIRRTFPTQAAARSWRVDALSAQQRGRLAPTTRRTLRESAQAWLEGATADPPVILSRSGQPYKPSVLRGYAADLRNHVLPDLGGRRLADVRRGDLQALVDRLLGQGLSPSKALPEVDRALWATAFYAGLRLGELRALRWDDVDLVAGLIRVERGWDDKAGAIAPKSEKGRRRVPIMGALAGYLERHRELTGRSGRDLVFGWTASLPFTPSHMRKRALKAWAATAVGAFLRGESLSIELRPIGFHELRHSFVSFAAAAIGPNGERLKPEEVGDMVGHSGVYMTERYRHEFEGRAKTYGGVLDNYRALAFAGGRPRKPSVQPQPGMQGEEPTALVKTFARLLDDTDPEEVVASGAMIRALLDEYIARADTSGV